jgi:hypothetical protein
MAHVFGAVASWRMNYRRRQMFLETSPGANLGSGLEAQGTLRGLLCICAWCKRIRDEAEAWESVEEYVQSRTHVSFSHGICPECSHSLK